MAIVVDTSVIMACLLEEAGHAALIDLMTGRALIAPASLPWEIGNALAAGFKRGRTSLGEALAAQAAYRTMTILLHSVDVSASLRLCHSLRIYAYDAFQLQCAIEYQCPLLTIDRGLKTAARGARVSVLET